MIPDTSIEASDDTPGVDPVEEFPPPPRPPECILHYHACPECVELGYKKCQRSTDQIGSKSHSPLTDSAR